MPISLAKDGVFWTVQGEGRLLGTPMVFVRFAGCSINCPECDTDYRVHTRVSADDLIQRALSALPPNYSPDWVWLTGGEPLDQDIEPVIDGLKTVGFKVALATAGEKEVPGGVAWISVSPHHTGFVQRHGHEVKVVLGLNNTGVSLVDEVDRHGAFSYKYVQPCVERQGALASCLEVVKYRGTGWRLSIQAHKHWGVP